MVDNTGGFPGGKNLLGGDKVIPPRKVSNYLEYRVRRALMLTGRAFKLGVYAIGFVSIAAIGISVFPTAPIGALAYWGAGLLAGRYCYKGLVTPRSLLNERRQAIHREHGFVRRVYLRSQNPKPFFHHPLPIYEPNLEQTDPQVVPGPQKAYTPPAAPPAAENKIILNPPSIDSVPQVVNATDPLSQVGGFAPIDSPLYTDSGKEVPLFYKRGVNGNRLFVFRVPEGETVKDVGALSEYLTNAKRDGRRIVGEVFLCSGEGANGVHHFVIDRQTAQLVDHGYHHSRDLARLLQIRANAVPEYDVKDSQVSQAPVVESSFSDGAPLPSIDDAPPMDEGFNYFDDGKPADFSSPPGGDLQPPSTPKAPLDDKPTVDDSGLDLSVWG